MKQIFLTYSGLIWLRTQSSNLFERWSRVDRNSVHYHSRKVTLMKRVAMFMMLGLLLILLILPVTPFGNQRFKVVLNQVEQEPDHTGAYLQGLRLHGVDKKNQPFSLQADYAVPETVDKVKLKTINADKSFESGAWIAVVSDEGFYYESKKAADLEGGVTMFTDSGYEMTSQSAHIAMEEGEIYSEERTYIQGPLGTLEAAGFIMKGKGDSIHFYGGVYIVSYPDSAPNINSPAPLN